jgi:hypothetical protein
LGVLTVKEGANVAKITLEGDYLGQTFTLSAGPGGGTKVVDPAATSTSSATTEFVSAMAGFGIVGGSLTEAPPARAIVTPLLAHAA